MDELTRGKYFDPREVNIKEAGLNVIRGFKFTLCELKSGLFLQIDVCSRVFRASNLLEEISYSKNKDYADSLVGSTVITNYGRRRTYRIEKICYDMNPMSKFYHEKRAGQISFADYYRESYGLKVTAKNQPMIEVILRVEKKFAKGGTEILKDDIKGYLIPEFISLTGMSDEQRADFRIMKSIAPETKFEPRQRFDLTQDIIETMNESGKFKINKPKKIDAYQLFQPYVSIYNNMVVKNHGDGSMNIRDTLKNSKHFKDWVLVYSVGKNPKYDDKDADDLVGILTKASAAFGVKFD